MLNLLFCGGEDLEGWHENVLVLLEQYARDHGCSGMELIGRAGWKKFLQKNGWSATYLVCERNFDKEALEEEEEAA